MSRSHEGRAPSPVGGAWTHEERELAHAEAAREPRVTVHTWRGIAGEVRVDEHGHAVGTTESVRRLLDSMAVVEPGTLAPLAPVDGVHYLDALPANMAGTYVRAERRRR